jgi:CDP-diacylglycerol--glycerol-3-phosphate 3-phosphatidyltransferase
MLTLLKPRFKRALHPVAASLYGLGVTANHVTLFSLAGSFMVGVALVCHSETTSLFAILPVWLLARMALATIDGTLAIDFGQKGRLGGVLNEVGDIVSDVALFWPLAFVLPFTPRAIAVAIGFVVLSETVGMAGAWFGGSRRVDGPFGKVDRSLALASLAIWLACASSLPAIFAVLPLIFVFMSLLTIGNRLRFAIMETRAA